MENGVNNRVVLAVNFKGECKLFNIHAHNSFLSLQSQVRAQWNELYSCNFSFSCSVGNFLNCSVESDNDLTNFSIVCNQSSSKLISAQLSKIGPITHVENSLLSYNIPVQSPHPFASDNNIPCRLDSGEVCEFAGVLSMPSYDVSPPLIKGVFLSDHWADLMKGGVGAVFTGGCSQFRCSLRKYSAKMGFRFMFLKNTDKYIYVVCRESTSGCEWFIRAKLCKASEYFVIYKANFTHKCIGKVLKDKTKRLGPKILGDLMMSDVKSNPDIVGKDVTLVIRNKYGFEIPYYKAWRAIEVAKDHIYGRFDDSYDELRWYCEAVRRTNPGSIVSLESDPSTHRFVRVFFAFNACREGFKSCRPMLFIDGTFLKGRAKGTLLAATAKDGNNGLFPVAFALVSAENLSNWEWFIRMINDNVKHEKEICYVSDRNCGLLAALDAVFDKPKHMYCLYHLLGNLKARFSSGWSNDQRGDLCEMFKACAYAPDERLFNQKINVFKLAGGKLAEEWLSQIPYEKWAVAHSTHIARYGEMTSNAIESFNNWILEARSLPVIKMIDWIRQNIARWYVERREISQKWSSPLVHKKQIDWNVMYDTGRAWVVSLSPSGQFEVQSELSSLVDLKDNTCSCHQWRVTGFPCSHAIAVIMRQNCDYRSYVEDCFYTSSYIKSYASNINPIPDTIRFECELVCDQQKILPPLLNRRPGRPKKLRHPSVGEYPKKKSPPCGHCGKRGYHEPGCVKTNRMGGAV